MTHRLLFLLLICCFSTTLLRAQSGDAVWTELDDIAIVEEKVMVPMRDGVRLATDIYRPKTDQPVPIIFSRTPYNFNIWQEGKKTSRTAQRALAAVKKG